MVGPVPIYGHFGQPYIWPVLKFGSLTGSDLGESVPNKSLKKLFTPLSIPANARVKPPGRPGPGPPPLAPSVTDAASVIPRCLIIPPPFTANNSFCLQPQSH